MYKAFFIKLLLSLAVVWIIAGSIFWHNYTLGGLGLIAFSLGLRHGFDVDHIVAIDNITRKFAYENKPSHTTGFFFALGHSSIVFLLTLIIVLGVISFQEQINRMADYGGYIGSIVSACFLLLTAFMNLLTISQVLKNKQHIHVLPRGLLAFLARRLFYLVDRPLKMYVVGFFFGLGFDTASEVALLGLAASATLHGSSLWNILILPILFASGMILVDSCDSLFMTSVYRWANTNYKRLKWYNLAVLSIATLAAIIVSVCEIINLGVNNLHLNVIPDFINLLTDLVTNHSEICGGFIVLIFLSFWLYAFIRQAKI